VGYRRRVNVSAAIQRARPVARRGFWWLTYFLVASAITHAFMTRWAIMIHEYLGRMMDHSIARPFVYRVLSPEIVKNLIALVPASVGERWLDDSDPQNPGRAVDMATEYGWPVDDSVALVVVVAFFILCLVGIALCWRQTLLELELPRATADAAPVIGLALLPLSFMKGGYLYDFPELLLASLAMLQLLQRRWWAYYLVFALACLNKESAILLGAWSVVLWPERKRFMGHVAMHALIGLPIVIGFRVLFADNPGEAQQINLLHNLGFLASPRTYLRFFDVYAAGVPAPQGLNVISASIFAFLMWAGIRRVPTDVKRIALITPLTILPLFLFFGWEDELRVFGIAFPAFFVVGTAGLRSLYDTDGRLGARGQDPQHREADPEGLLAEAAEEPGYSPR